MKIKPLTILAVMLIAAGFITDTSARTFTRASDGKTLEGEFVRMKDDKTAFIKRASGQTIGLPVALLTEADQAFIKEKAAAAKLEASSEESVGENWFREGAEVVIECGFIGFLGAETVRFSGDQF
jgi:hypothetical protein